MAYTNLRLNERLGGWLMENDWQKFTMTGSVQDYLSYCNKRETQEMWKMKNNQTGESDNGTNEYSAWHGNSNTAYR